MPREKQAGRQSMIPIAIIGAGPAGMLAALKASVSQPVLLIDLNPSPGRKLAATGAGRGNLSNREASPADYRSQSPRFVSAVLQQYGHQDLVNDLRQLGVFCYCTDDGWCYPVSNSAANVVELLSAQLRSRGVELMPETRVIGIDRKDSSFLLHLEGRPAPLSVRAVLVATGGKAAPQLGANTDLLEAVRRLGHGIQPMLPALAPLLTATKPIHKLQGVRLDATLSLYDSKARLGESTGNVLFTDTGISGPAAMNLSQLVQPHGQHDYQLVIDFLAGYRHDFSTLLEQNQSSQVPLVIWLKSILPAKVARWIADKCGIPLSMPLEKVPRAQTAKCLELLGGFHLPVMGTRGFEFAQLSTGGVALTEVSAATMMSKKISNLFFAGEVLDVQGPCGGYNLLWAFASGAIAGSALATLSD